MKSDSIISSPFEGGPPLDLLTGEGVFDPPPGVVDPGEMAEFPMLRVRERDLDGRVVGLWKPLEENRLSFPAGVMEIGGGVMCDLPGIVDEGDETRRKVS